MHNFTLLQFVLVALLILVNGFFVATEFVLVSIRETRVEQLLEAGVAGARAVRRLQQGLDDVLPAVQLGVTLCSLMLGWVGEPLAVSLLLGPVSMLPHAHVYAQAIAVVVGFALITYFHVVIGELVPKALALRRAEALALAVAPPMMAFMAAARPAVRLLKGGAALVLRTFDVPMSERAQVHSAEELKLMATAARRMGLLPEFEETLVHRSLEIEEISVHEIMTPRQKIFSLPAEMSLEDAGSRLMARHYTCVPVYDGERGPEHIVGIIYARDLARLLYFRPASGAARGPFAALRLRQLMREALVVPETKSVLDLLQEFQQRRRQMAIVVDEYGSVVGLVTVEDAVEQITGELEDEFDSPAVPLLSDSDGALTLDGGVNLRDLETQMQWDLPREGGIETLAGFLLTQFGHIPQEGESLLFENRRLTIESMDGRRISRVRVEKLAGKTAPS
jgi:CBS domain containing-hemolysin-like protein